MPVRVCVIVVVWLGWASRLASEGANHPIPPDVELQRRIDRAAEAAAKPHVPRLQQVAEIEKLRDIESKMPAKLVEQLLRYYTDETNEDERRFQAFLMLGYFNVPKPTIARVVTPYIYTDHLPLQAEVNRLLAGVENGEGVRLPDYSYYESLIRARKDAPPANLVRHMYERSPAMAVLTMMVVYMERETHEAQKPILWAEHVLSDVLWRQKYGFLEKNEVPQEAAAELEKLSKHEAWWARLYVAEIVRQHPQFRTPVLIDRLKADEHELVGRAIQEAEQPRGQKKTSESKAEDRERGQSALCH